MGGYLELNPFGGIQFLFRSVTIGHAQTVSVSALCCLEQHTEQSASVTEIVALRNLLVSIWVRAQVHSPDTNFLCDQPTLSRLTNVYIY